jgi:hypothetical protein
VINQRSEFRELFAQLRVLCDAGHTQGTSHHGHRHAAQGQGRSDELTGARQGLCDSRSGGRRALTFLANSAVAEEITKDSEYKGTRILMDARMDNVRLRIQIDFGVGDVMVPGPRMIEYPVFLGSDTIKLLAYPVESAIAEKLQAMVALGTANSRMKDFYDVWICPNHLDFNTDILIKAVDATFRNR